MKPIITRQQAKDAGLKRYFLNMPCIHGHTAERYVIGRTCVPCVFERSKRRAKRIKRWLIPHVREENRIRSREWYKVNKQRSKEAYWRRIGADLPSRPRSELCEAGCRNAASVMDHDHKTGAFRGWLCNECNVALGHLGGGTLKDTAEGVSKAIEKLEAKLHRAKGLLSYLQQ